MSNGKLPRQRGEVETPTSNQPPHVDRGRRLLGPLTLPRSQALACLGPGGYCRLLGTGVPRLACLRPAAWLKGWPSTAHLHQLKLKTLARGQASRGGRRKASSGAASPGWLARSREIKARGTSRGAHDASHDNRDQAGARPCSVLVYSLVQRGKAQAWSTEASREGYHFGATRPRPTERHDGGHRGAQDSVTTRALCRRRLLLSG